MRRDVRAQLRSLGVTSPRLRLSDLARESVLSVVRYPGRSLLTALGTVLGAAAFVCTLGLSSTLGQQVSASFDVRRATEIVVRPEDPAVGAGWQESAALARLASLNGVRSAGRRIVFKADRPVRRAASFGADESGMRIIGADPGALRVMAPRLVTGRLFDGFAERSAAPVALLAKPVADQLGITRTQSAVYIDNRAYTVMGIYDDVARRPEVMQAVIIPFRTAEALTGADAEVADRDVLIETAPGAAQLIGAQAPLALHPAEPQRLRAIAPPDPRLLRRQIEGDVTRSSLLISLIALVIGTVSIGNAATAGVAARTQEIGLRRAVGGRPAHIFAQLIGETTMLGALGGIAGGLAGVCVTLAVSLVNGWVPVLDLRLALLATLGCAAAGLLAGFLPAARAVRIQPVAALQR